MPVLAVVGLQWGDEGKGKIVDGLVSGIGASEVKHVMRAQGGPNAGHTVIAEGKEFRFHSIPSGILYQSVACYICGGCVIDPKGLLNELKALKEEGVSFEGKLKISSYASCIFPYHQVLDSLQETEKEDRAIGTTGKGIGPCYADLVGRMGIRMGDLIDPNRLKECLDRILPYKNRELSSCHSPDLFDGDALLKEYSLYGQVLRSYVTPFERDMNGIQKERVILEGAQGTLLDVIFGTYPYVTSSHTLSASLCMGAGMGPTHVTQVLGVIKAYSSRVGHGPFPTQFLKEDEENIPDAMQEIGTTTQRKRRIGWFDAVLVKHAISLNGVSALALTKLDVLGGLEVINVCVKYRLRQDEIAFFPQDLKDLMQVKPVYRTLSGWKKPIGLIKRFEDLPRNARVYVECLEQLCGVPIKMVSFGPEREKTLLREAVF